MVLDILLLTLGFFGLVIASIIDIKTREVPDLLNYGLIISGSAIRLFDAIIYNNWQTLLYTLLGFIAFFAIANMMYYSKQWGGGDAKLLMAVSIIFAQYPSTLLNFLSPNLSTFPFLMIFFINLLIIGSIYGLLFTIILALKNKEKFIQEFRHSSQGKSILWIRKLFLLLAIIVLATLFLTDFSLLLSSMLVILIIFIAAMPYLIIFIRAVEKASMYHMVDVGKLTEGDWIAIDIMANGKPIYKSASPGVTRHQIEEIRKHNIKKVLVKEGMPFVPSFLIAMIFTLVFGNPLPV
jgi:Flp pilus assembly protein protease CpaA